MLYVTYPVRTRKGFFTPHANFSVINTDFSSIEMSQTTGSCLQEHIPQTESVSRKIHCDSASGVN